MADREGGVMAFSHLKALVCSFNISNLNDLKDVTVTIRPRKDKVCEAPNVGRSIYNFLQQTHVDCVGRKAGGNCFSVGHSSCGCAPATPLLTLALAPDPRGVWFWAGGEQGAS